MDKMSNEWTNLELKCGLRAKPQIGLGGLLHIGIVAAEVRRQQRSHLVHDLGGHLIAHITGEGLAACIQVKWLPNDNLNPGAAEVQELFFVVCMAVIDHRQDGRTAAHRQQHNAGVPFLQTAMPAAGAFGGHGHNFAGGERLLRQADRRQVGFAAADGDAIPDVEQDAKQRIIPGFDLGNGSYGAGIKMLEALWRIHLIDVFHCQNQLALLGH